VETDKGIKSLPYDIGLLKYIGIKKSEFVAKSQFCVNEIKTISLLNSEFLKNFQNGSGKIVCILSVGKLDNIISLV